MHLLLLSVAANAEVNRHAVVVGSNSGGPGLEPLLYAEQDAGRVAEVLAELGGFDSGHITVLYAPTPSELNAALAEHAWLAGSSDDDLFFFYYSGHADARGLRLGDEVLPFKDLRNQIKGMESEVKLGVLDACRSGEITRLKGLELSQPFADENELVTEGEAWLAATSADEAAQESDAIRGSFFTHYLVSGLRGAADTGDGIVSLDEAYRYTYERTVARTGGTAAGTQHPVYDFQLTGQGDLPLTDVRRANARLTLPANVGGVLTVLRLPDRVPIAEIAKNKGEIASVGLPAGRYTLVLHDGDRSGETMVGLSEGANLTIPDFATKPAELASAKGEAAPPPAVAPAQETTASAIYRQTLNALNTADSSVDQLDEIVERFAENRAELDLRHRPSIAAGASAIIPGMGQVYNGQWFRGGAFLVATGSLTSGGVVLGQGWHGSLAGAHPAGLMSAMVWGWAISDAAWQVEAKDNFRPKTGLALGFGTGWYSDRGSNVDWDTAGGATVSSSGITADWIVEPGFSMGLDRTGWFQRADGTWEARLGGRMMVAAEGRRWRPGLLVAVGTDFGPAPETEVVLRPVLGAGGNLRWYATPHYFLEVETRAEFESGEVSQVWAGGLGVHLGH